MTTPKQRSKQLPGQTAIPDPSEPLVKMQRINLRRDEWENIRLMAAIHGESVSTWLAVAAEERLRKDRKDPYYTAAIAAATNRRS